MTFDISTQPHEFPYAILCEPSDDGCHLGISLSKVVNGTRYQWWMNIRTMQGVLKANSLVDWLNGKTTDPATFEWQWDRIPFFGPVPKVRSGNVDSKWQERVDATQPRLKELVVARKRENCDEVGPDVLPLQIQHGTKRKLEEVEEEKEEKEEEEPTFCKEEIWVDQINMTRKYLAENHKQMRRQGVDLPYFRTYRMYRM